MALRTCTSVRLRHTCARFDPSRKISRLYAVEVKGTRGEQGHQWRGNIMCSTCLACSFFFFFRTPSFYAPTLLPLLIMSDFGDYEDGDQSVFGPPPSESLNNWNEDVFSQRMPRPPQAPLRPWPPIGRRLATDSDLGYSLPMNAHYPPSHMSGSTLRGVGSSLNPPRAPLFSHSDNMKPSFSYESAINIPSEVLESLTVAQLYQNPFHRRLQCKYEEVCDVLAAYNQNNSAAVPQAFAMPHAAFSSDNFQGMSHFTSKRTLPLNQFHIGNSSLPHRHS